MAAGLHTIDVTKMPPESEHALTGVRWLPYAPLGSVQLGELAGEAVADGGHSLLLERHGAFCVPCSVLLPSHERIASRTRSGVIGR